MCDYQLDVGHWHLSLNDLQLTYLQTQFSSRIDTDTSPFCDCHVVKKIFQNINRSWNGSLWLWRKDKQSSFESVSCVCCLDTRIELIYSLRHVKARMSVVLLRCSSYYIRLPCAPAQVYNVVNSYTEHNMSLKNESKTV